jgi:hypothetical protein
MVALVLASCSNPAGGGSSAKTITSFTQLPSGTWVYSSTQTQSGFAYTTTNTLVTNGSSSATMTTLIDMTAVVTGLAIQNGTAESTVWNALKSSYATIYPGATFTSSSPYTITSVQAATDSVAFTSATEATLDGNALTIVSGGKTMVYVRQ